jgi:integrase
MIVKTAQGRFRVRVKDRGVVVADRTFARWNDAQAWEADRKRKVAAGRLAPASASRTALADVYAAWAHVRPAQVQARTWQSDQSAWATHLQPRFGRAPVGSITTLAVHDFAADLRATHTLGTVQRVIASLIALMEFALDHHYIETNPARIRLHLQRDARPHYVTLDPSELMAVWALQRKDSPYGDVTLFLALTGLRWAEFTALRPCDIHATADGGPMAHICRSIVRARGEGPPLVKSTKTDADRMVPLPRLAAGIADHWSRGKDHRALLVPGPDGGPLRGSTFRRQVHWDQTTPSGFRIHDLRHSCATNLLKNGADILGVQGILGHASAATTLRYYGHITGNEHLRNAMNHYENPLAQWDLPEQADGSPAPSRGRVPAAGADSGPSTPTKQHPETDEKGSKPQQ